MLTEAIQQRLCKQVSFLEMAHNFLWSVMGELYEARSQRDFISGLLPASFHAFPVIIKLK